MLPTPFHVIHYNSCFLLLLYTVCCQHLYSNLSSNDHFDCTQHLDYLILLLTIAHLILLINISYTCNTIFTIAITSLLQYYITSIVFILNLEEHVLAGKDGLMNTFSIDNRGAMVDGNWLYLSNRGFLLLTEQSLSPRHMSLECPALLFPSGVLW